MTDNILYRIRCQDLQLMEEVIASWKAGGCDATRVAEVEEAVRFCQHLPDELRDIWETAGHRQRVVPMREFQRTGEAILGLFDRALRVVEQVQDRVHECEDHEQPVRRSRHLQGVRHQLFYEPDEETLRVVNRRYVTSGL